VRLNYQVRSLNPPSITLQAHVSDSWNLNFSLRLNNVCLNYQVRSLNPPSITLQAHVSDSWNLNFSLWLNNVRLNYQVRSLNLKKRKKNAVSKTLSKTPPNVKISHYETKLCHL